MLCKRRDGCLPVHSFKYLSTRCWILRGTFSLTRVSLSKRLCLGARFHQHASLCPSVFVWEPVFTNTRLFVQASLSASPFSPTRVSLSKRLCLGVRFYQHASLCPSVFVWEPVFTNTRLFVQASLSASPFSPTRVSLSKRLCLGARFHQHASLCPSVFVCEPVFANTRLFVQASLSGSPFSPTRVSLSESLCLGSRFSILFVWKPAGFHVARVLYTRLRSGARVPLRTLFSKAWCLSRLFSPITHDSCPSASVCGTCLHITTTLLFALCYPHLCS